MRISKIHNDFQSFLDSIIEKHCSIEEKINSLKTHLLEKQALYEQMLFTFFLDEKLENHEYFYITFTYQDRPISFQIGNEIVVSMLYDEEHQFYFEISIFNYQNTSQEQTIQFNRSSEFLN